MHCSISKSSRRCTCDSTAELLFPLVQLRQSGAQLPDQLSQFTPPSDGFC